MQAATKQSELSRSCREVDYAVASRFLTLCRCNAFERRDGEYIYGTDRTSPMKLGPRFRQRVLCSLQAAPQLGMANAVTRGDFDFEIETTWHDAAAAEWWYRQEELYAP